jgi:hypothetical protein
VPLLGAGALTVFFGLLWFFNQFSLLRHGELSLQDITNKVPLLTGRK